jgi:hypothetical protein
MSKPDIRVTGGRMIVLSDVSGLLETLVVGVEVASVDLGPDDGVGRLDGVKVMSSVPSVMTMSVVIGASLSGVSCLGVSH